jgi:rhamnosyltransferase
MISIIIRTKNEEKWITSCLRSVFNQTYKDFEVIIVDNNSTDMTLERARAYDVKVVVIDNFLPGKAINYGIRQCKGDIVVCLSGHCIPVNNRWLDNLISKFEDDNVAGIYGRQEPMSFTSDSDKRDLITIFGLDRKVQKKDPFFHNANSAFRRDIWEKIPFDEQVTNIEDRIWGKEVVSNGYYIIYEPEASVYHYHGIHQDGDPDRCRNVVRILENLEYSEEKRRNIELDINELDIIAIIPVKGDVQFCGKRSLLEYTVQRALESDFIDKVVVSTDNQELADIATEFGAEVPFIRPEELSLEYVDIEMVLQYSLERLEDANILPDVVVALEVTYPFRPKGYIDKLISELVSNGLDSIISVAPECRTVWMKEDEDTKMLGTGLMPRQLKNTLLYVSLIGCGIATHPHTIRGGSLLGNKTGILEVAGPYSCLEVRDEETIDFASKLIDEWWEQNK